MADWAHAPIHRLDEGGAYLVTAATYGKEHYFSTPQRLTVLHERLLGLASEHSWRLQAWAVFSNHYHFVGHSEAGAENLRGVLKHLHGETSRELNALGIITDSWLSAASFYHRLGYRTPGAIFLIKDLCSASPYPRGER